MRVAAVRLLALAVLILWALPRLEAQRVGGQARSFRVNDAELYVETRGSGPPLVLLHGFLGCGAVWSPFVERLAAEYQLIIPDLRGHGRSTNPGGRFTHRQTARDLLALLDQMGLARVRALGISSGGMTVLHAALLAPERFEAIGLIGATTHFPPEARTIMQQSSSLEAMPPEVLEEFRGCASRGDGQLRELLQIFHGFKDSVDDMNLTAADLQQLKARALIIHGDRDEFFPVQIPVDAYRAIPRAYLYVIPNGDHVPIYGPRAEPFRNEVLAFLRGDWERR